MKAIWNGDLLKVRRKALGLRTKELAQKIGCTRPIVSMWEQGKSSPSGHFLVLMGIVLSCHPHEFYKVESLDVDEATQK